MSCGENLGKYWSTVPDGRKMPLAILSGMSQMHTINERKPGDELICELLDDSLTPQGVRVWGFAAPNLCNEEAVFQLVSLLTDPAKKPKFFIYGLCFDKMRNLDLRIGYQQFLREHSEIQRAYAATAHEYESKYPLAAAKMLASLGAVEKTQAQQSESFESELRAEVGKAVPLVGARKDLNGSAQMQLMLARNYVLHIKADSKRAVIQSRYDLNFQFLKMLNDLARTNGVQPIYYVIPLNPQGDNPYIPEEYAHFKEQIKAYCEAAQIPFDNFEKAVPADDWGTFLGGPDFKHFTEAGHKITSQAILHSPAIGPVLAGSAITATQAAGEPAGGTAP